MDEDKFQGCLKFRGLFTVGKGGREKNICLKKSQIQTTILLKNLLNFLSLLSESVGSRYRIQIAEFPLPVGSHFEPELQSSHFGKQKKELVFLFCISVCFV